VINRETKLRIARPSADIQRISQMYMEGLGFEKLGFFQDHDGFSGVMLGHPQQIYHLEFTEKSGDDSLVPPHPDQLVVFYVPDKNEWEKACTKIVKAGFLEVPAHNPFWDLCGKTFADLDGYRLVLQNQAWLF